MLPHAMPWSDILQGNRMGRLLGSGLVFSHGKPCAIADTAWIKKLRKHAPAGLVATLPLGVLLIIVAS
jgi:hypothetical protein